MIDNRDFKTIYCWRADGDARHYTLWLCFISFMLQGFMFWIPAVPTKPRPFGMCPIFVANWLTNSGAIWPFGAFSVFL